MLHYGVTYAILTQTSALKKRNHAGFDFLTKQWFQDALSSIGPVLKRHIRAHLLHLYLRLALYAFLRIL